MIEDELPENLRISAYHPSLFIYAFKKNILEKLFEELMASNTAILGGEVWLVDGIKVDMIIPLRTGDMQTYSWKIETKKREDWYDFVERSTKESLEKVNDWNLEKNSRLGLRNKIWYHLFLSKEK